MICDDFLAGATLGEANSNVVSVSVRPLLDFLGTDAARKEIVFRRAGQNEISIIGVCQELVNVRNEYCSAELQHAQKILSDALRHNGLY
jgi:hypothetical protein